MPQVMSYHDIEPSGFQRDDNRGPDHPANEAATFFRPASNQPHYPNAFLVRMFSQGGAHYHGADEFQVVVEGKGKLGRHDLTPVSVHFARAYTPYGPLFPDKDTGWGFLTLRVRLNPDGTQRIPAATEKLKKIPNRKPWQTSVHVSFDKRAWQTCRRSRTTRACSRRRSIWQPEKAPNAAPPRVAMASMW